MGTISRFSSYSRESTTDRQEQTSKSESFSRIININSFSMTSKIRQNFHEESEALINKQINMEFYASYVYLSMASYFNRDDQALHGFSSFFQKNSNEERDHGMKLMNYQAKRGGRGVFQDIAKPSSMEWGTPIDAVEAALELEKTVNQSLLELHKASDA